MKGYEDKLCLQYENIQSHSIVMLIFTPLNVKLNVIFMFTCNMYVRLALLCTHYKLNYIRVTYKLRKVSYILMLYTSSYVYMLMYKNRDKRHNVLV